MLQCMAVPCLGLPAPAAPVSFVASRVTAHRDCQGELANSWEGTLRFEVHVRDLSVGSPLTKEPNQCCLQHTHIDIDAQALS